MRRVVKSEVARDTINRPDGLEICLDCWKMYMHSDPDRDMGIKTMSGLTSDTDSYGIDESEAQQSRDMRIGAATDAQIRSLKMLHTWAIHKMCSLAYPCKFPQADILIIGPEAVAELKIKLKNNVATGILF